MLEKALESPGISFCSICTNPLSVQFLEHFIVFVVIVEGVNPLQPNPHLGKKKQPQDLFVALTSEYFRKVLAFTDEFKSAFTPASFSSVESH